MMTDVEKNIVAAIQHITNTARFLAYKGERHEKIAGLLDQADYLFNLVQEQNVNFDRIRRVLSSISEEYPECSRDILNIE